MLQEKGYVVKVSEESGVSDENLRGAKEGIQHMRHNDDILTQLITGVNIEKKKHGPNHSLILA
jgi:hypothetical protein